MDRVPRTTEGSNFGQDKSRLEFLEGGDSLDQQCIMESFEFYVTQLGFGLVFSLCSSQDWKVRHLKAYALVAFGAHTEVIIRTRGTFGNFPS